MLLTAIFALAAPPFQIQAYKQVLTPPEQLPLGGYTERGDKISEPGGKTLYSHTLVISQGKTKVALVSFEGLSVPESLHREVQKRIDIPVFLVATHTHCAPDTQMLNERMTLRIPGIASFKRQWLDWYSLKIAGGIAIAQQQIPIPTNLNLDQSLTDLARPRRKNTTVSNVATRIFGENRNSIITIFGAHATCHDSDTLTTHGDWPGDYMFHYGGLVFPGAIGNASPNVDNGDGDDKSITIANDLASVQAEPTPVTPNLSFTTEPIKLDSVKPHPDFAKEYKINDALAQIAVSKFAPTKAELTAVTIGNLIILGVPGEPSGDLEAPIIAAAEKRGYRCAVVSHCNGWIGYILDPKDYDRGGYEATLSFHGRDTATRVIDAATRLIQKLPSPAKAAYSTQK